MSISPIPTPSSTPDLSTNSYRIFLLTIWQEDQNNWRFLLEDPRSGERTDFSGVDSLAAGLQDVIDATDRLTDLDN